MGDSAVASESRLFVGQIPSGTREEQLWGLFSPYGTIRNLHLLKGFDSKPRGCAMVLFARWSQAEAAAEALNGKTGQLVGQTRPLVVHFANPRRSPQGPPEPGIAPRKLFVGQVPRDVTEEVLRPLFQPYGEIEHISVLRTQRGQSAGCAFVQFSRWAEAEDAIEAHNGKTRLPGSDVPMVVKFADAKRRDTKAVNSRAALDQWNAGLRRQPPDLADLAGVGFNSAHLLAGMGRPMGGMGMGPYGKPTMADGSGAEYGGYNGLGGNMLSEQQLLGPLSQLSLGGMGNQSNVQGYSMQQQQPQQAQQDGVGLGGLPSSNYTDLMAMQLAQGGNPRGSALGPQGHLAQMPLPVGLYGQSPLLGGMQEQGRNWGQRINAHDRHNEWKLFIGQVPLEATERDLEEIFLPLGEIVELYILRNNNGKSRGCAFVTYANQLQAQQAITQLNGRHVPPNKALVVKFADRAAAAASDVPAAVGSPVAQPFFAS